MAAAWVRLPAVGFGGVETNVNRGAGWVVGIEHSHDRSPAHKLAGDPGGDALASHVGRHLVFQLRRIGAALADEVPFEPLAGDALELTKKVEFGVFAQVAPLGENEMRHQLI